MEELNTKVNNNTAELESEILSLELKLRKAGKLLETANQLPHGTDLQIYIGSKTIETEVVKETELLQDLVNYKSLKHLGVKFKRNSKRS